MKKCFCHLQWKLSCSSYLTFGIGAPEKRPRFIYTTTRSDFAFTTSACTRRLTRHPTDIHTMGCNIAPHGVYIRWMWCKPPCTCRMFFNLVRSSSELTAHCKDKPGSTPCAPTLAMHESTVHQEAFKGDCPPVLALHESTVHQEAFK